MTNEEELREKVRHIMYDAHINRHWACNAGCGVHEGTGSPMVQMMRILTSEIEKAKVEACKELEKMTTESYNSIVWKDMDMDSVSSYDDAFEQGASVLYRRINIELSKLQEKQNER